MGTWFGWTILPPDAMILPSDFENCSPDKGFAVVTKAGADGVGAAGAAVEVDGAEAGAAVGFFTAFAFSTAGAAAAAGFAVFAAGAAGVVTPFPESVVAAAASWAFLASMHAFFQCGLRQFSHFPHLPPFLTGAKRGFLFEASESLSYTI